mgnify:CR=1 FL=1|tara:strand:+ start:26304 stop:26840 length:537 start_codon:yes stop_codon:yes gene_type:complete
MDSELKLFSPEGRIGRIRFILYSFLVPIISMAIALVAGLVLAFIPVIGPILAVLVYIAAGIWVLVFDFFIVIKRCHDFDVSGWLSLLMIVPLIGGIFVLVLWFIPGTAGENRFGKPLSPTSSGTKIFAIALVVLSIITYVTFASVIKDYAKKIEAHSSVQIQQTQTTTYASSGHRVNT